MGRSHRRRRPPAPAGTPLALVPAGTANDFAHRMGLPIELAAACRLAALGMQTAQMELGWMGDRP